MPYEIYQSPSAYHLSYELVSWVYCCCLSVSIAFLFKIRQNMFIHILKPFAALDYANRTLDSRDLCALRLWPIDLLDCRNVNLKNVAKDYIFITFSSILLRAKVVVPTKRRVHVDCDISFSHESLLLLGIWMILTQSRNIAKSLTK